MILPIDKLPLYTFIFSLFYMSLCHIYTMYTSIRLFTQPLLCINIVVGYMVWSLDFAGIHL